MVNSPRTLLERPVAPAGLDRDVGHARVLAGVEGAVAVLVVEHGARHGEGRLHGAWAGGAAATAAAAAGGQGRDEGEQEGEGIAWTRTAKITQRAGGESKRSPVLYFALPNG